MFVIALETGGNFPQDMTVSRVKGRCDNDFHYRLFFRNDHRPNTGSGCGSMDPGRRIPESPRRRTLPQHKFHLRRWDQSESNMEISTQVTLLNIRNVKDYKRSLTVCARSNISPWPPTLSCSWGWEVSTSVRCLKFPGSPRFGLRQSACRTLPCM